MLVTVADTMGAIGVIRSLGRAGYPVHSCSSKPQALGLSSKFTDVATVCPDIKGDGFVPWLRSYVENNKITAIIPSESVLLSIQNVFDEFSPLLPMSSSADVVYSGMSKFDLFKFLLSDDSLKSALPPTVLVHDTKSLPSEEELEKLGKPFFIKADGLYSTNASSGSTFKAKDTQSCIEKMKSYASNFSRLIVQGTVPGQGVGAFFCIWNGKVVAEFMHRRLHEVPHTGGASSFRESWRHEAIRDHALRVLQGIRWQGVAMMEYRWDPETDKCWLIEMNGRFWGSLHLMLYAGVDFPRLLLDSFHGHDTGTAPKYPLNVRCRHTFPSEVHYVWSCLKDRSLGVRRFWKIVEFFLLMAKPTVYSDLCFPGDRALYWYSFKDFLRTFRD